MGNKMIDTKVINNVKTLVSSLRNDMKVVDDIAVHYALNEIIEELYHNRQVNPAPSRSITRYVTGIGILDNIKHNLNDKLNKYMNTNGS